MPKDVWGPVPEQGDDSMRRILIYRLGSLGDTIVSLPCLHKIRDSFPDAERILLTNKPVSKAAPRMLDILRGSDLVHDAIEYEQQTRSPKVLAGLWLQIRRLRPEAMIYLATPRGTRVLARDLTFFRVCGISRVIGAPSTPDLMYNRVGPDGEEEYECARLARCVSSLGPLDLDDPAQWRLGLTSRESEEAAQALAPLGDRPFVAINMGTKSKVNDWGHDNWTALLTTLTRRFDDMHWVMVGAPSDTGRAEEIVSIRPSRMHNVCGKLSIRGTAAALSRARLFAGHDSGPLHLAAACAVPCVGVFSTINKPHKWYPYGQGHRVLYASGPISTIPVDRVYEAVAAGLRGEPAAAHAPLGDGVSRP